MPKIVVVHVDHEPELREIQIRNRGDGKDRYIANLPKSLFDRLLNRYKDKEGIYRIECVNVIIENGTPYLEFDKTAKGTF